MNSRQRIVAAIEGRAVDQVPVVPQITYYTADICDISWERAMKDPEDMAECLFEGQRRFGYDGVYAGWESSFNLVAGALGAHVSYREGSIPYVDRPLFTEPEEMDRLKVVEPARDERLSFHLEMTALLRKKLSPDIVLFSYVPGPLTLSSLLIGSDNLMKSILLRPAFVRELVERAAQSTIRYAQAKIENRAEVIVIADPVASGNMISPAMFEEFAMPSLAAAVDCISAQGAVPSIHICGKITGILNRLCEIKPKIIEIDYCNDLKTAREIAKDRVCLQGNLDPTGTLLMGDDEKVYRASRAAIAQGTLNGTYFILSSGCEVPMKTPPKNIDAMIPSNWESRQI